MGEGLYGAAIHKGSRVRQVRELNSGVMEWKGGAKGMEWNGDGSENWSRLDWYPIRLEWKAGKTWNGTERSGMEMGSGDLSDWKYQYGLGCNVLDWKSGIRWSGRKGMVWNKEH